MVEPRSVTLNLRSQKLLLLPIVGLVLIKIHSFHNDFDSRPLLYAHHSIYFHVLRISINHFIGIYKVFN